MTPERQEQLEQLARSLEPLTYPEYRRGLEEGREQGIIFAVQAMEAEVTGWADNGTLDANKELALALAKAAGWLRRKYGSK